MDEYSRILIEEYCMQSDSAKSRRLVKLVRKSYDINAEYTDSDAVRHPSCGRSDLRMLVGRR